MINGINRWQMVRPLALLMILAGAGVAQPAVVVNQLGYRPGDNKLAFLKNARGSGFQVVDVRSNKAVMKGGVVSIGRPDHTTGDEVFVIDFSAFRTPGRYQLWIPDAKLTSPEFDIGEDVYRAAVEATVESFTYQRCGTEVGNATIWHHPVCHHQDAFFFDAPELWRDVRGGWHDAGDYGKFVVTGALSAAFLLYAYEHAPQNFTDGQLDLPENKNGIPDILDEAAWELTWLLKVQTGGGGVFHKVTTKKWTGEYLPHLDPDPRYIFKVSSTATGSFAAVTALGARIFDRWDKPFARKLLKASLDAWSFLRENPHIVPSGGFKNPNGVVGGEYEDVTDTDERLWAATELYRLTRNEEYHDFVKREHRKLGGFNYTLGWQNVQNFAYATYLRMPALMKDAEVTGYFASTLTTLSEALLKRIEANVYRCVLRNEEYYWGSNSVLLGYAFNLLLAHEMTGQRKYLEGALDQLHYVLGRNTFNRVFVTGIGSNPVTQPYHQFSMMLNAGAPVPGLVVGGPNRGSRLNGKVLSQFPGKCYEDVAKNYFVNEVAINYTAPLTYLASYLVNGTEQGVRSSQSSTPGVE